MPGNGGRLPFEALEVYLDHGRPVSDEEAGRQLGTSGNTVASWRRVGLDPWMADRAAIRLGVHPFVVWLDDWLDLAEDYRRRTNERQRASQMRWRAAAKASA